eukprot:337482-Chlamydomonas_euryale.AAC.1
MHAIIPPLPPKAKPIQFASHAISHAMHLRTCDSTPGDPTPCPLSLHSLVIHRQPLQWIHHAPDAPRIVRLPRLRIRKATALKAPASGPMLCSTAARTSSAPALSLPPRRVSQAAQTGRGRPSLLN